MKPKYDLRIYEFDSGVYIGYFVDQEEATKHLEQILKNQEAVERLKKRIEELEQFLKDLAEARKHQEEHDTLKIAPIAGLLEKAELDGLQEILGKKK